MSEIKLLPCPFCGGEAKVSKSGGYAVVSCLDSSCNGNACCYKFNSPKEAIEKWNTRKPMQEIVERLEEMEEKALRVQNYDVSFYATGQIHKAIEIVKEVGGMNV